MIQATILESICKAWNIKPEHITCQSFTHTPARYQYFWLMRLNTELPLWAIGELGNRKYNKASVSIAIKQHHIRMKDVEYARRFELAAKLDI